MVGRSNSALLEEPPTTIGPPRTASQPGPQSHPVSREGTHIFRGAAALLSTQPLTWGASLLGAILLPRYLGDQGLGYYAVATTIAALVGTVAGLGVSYVLVRDVASDSSRAATDGPASVVLVTLSGLLMWVVVALALPLLGVPGDQHIVIGLALVGMVATLGNRVLTSVLNGQGRHAKQAWLNAAGTAGGTLAGLAALVAGGGAAGFLAASAGVTVITVFIGWHVCHFRLRRSAFTLIVWRGLALGGAPFLAWNVAMTIRNQIDVVLVAAILGPDAAGWLAAAYRIVFIPIFLPVVITTPLMPVLARLVHDQAAFARTVKRALQSVLVLTVPATAMILAVAPSVPGLLGWDSTFEHSVPLMMLLAVDQPLGAIDMVLGAALMALHRERRWLIVGLVAALFNPAANLLLLPIAKGFMDNAAVVAASVEVVTELVMMGGALLLLPRAMVGRKEASLAARVVLAAAGLVVVARAILPFSFVFAVVAGGLVFVIVAVLLRVLTQDEMRTLFGLGRAIFNRPKAPEAISGQ